MNVVVGLLMFVFWSSGGWFRAPPEEMTGRACRSRLVGVDELLRTAVEAGIHVDKPDDEATIATTIIGDQKAVFFSDIAWTEASLGVYVGE